MKAEEFERAITDIGLENPEISDLLGVREETIFKWRRGSKRIPDHYSNIVLSVLKERNHAEETKD